jgi:hemolysin activation/secretion protein
MKKSLAAFCLFFATSHLAPVWAADAPLIDVMEFAVEGNSVLPAVAIEEALGPYTGPGKTFKDLEEARAALEKVYQDAGYLSVVVSLPNQRVDAGMVRLEVTEATVDELKITGARYTLPSQVRKAVPSLAPGQVPNFPQVQRELAQVQGADRQVTPLIGSGDRPDALAVELKVEDKPALHGSVELNSRESFNTSRGRLEAAASYGNLWQAGHSLGLSWQYAPWRPSDANTLTVLYSLPITRDDDLSASFTNSNSDTPTGTSLGGSTITAGQFWGLRWRHGLAERGWPIRHSVTAGLDFKDSRERSRDVGGFTTEGPGVKYPVLSANYELTWTGSQGSVTTFSTTASSAISAMASRTIDCNGLTIDQFDCKRKGAQPDFFTLKLNASYRSPLVGKWWWGARFDAQIADAPLISNEQFSMGGLDSVRGYYEYEQSGDTGAVARLEVLPPAWNVTDVWRASPAVFFDTGVVRTVNPASTQRPRTGISSWGLAAQVDNGAGLKLAVTLAQALKDTLRAADNGTDQISTRAGDWRLDVSVRQGF